MIVAIQCKNYVVCLFVMWQYTYMYYCRYLERQDKTSFESDAMCLHREHVDKDRLDYAVYFGRFQTFHNINSQKIYAEFCKSNQSIDVLFSKYSETCIQSHPKDQQHVVLIHRTNYPGSITWKVQPWGPVKCGLYKQAVLIYWWSLEQI